MYIIHYFFCFPFNFFFIRWNIWFWWYFLSFTVILMLHYTRFFETAIRIQPCIFSYVSMFIISKSLPMVIISFAFISVFKFLLNHFPQLIIFIIYLIIDCSISGILFC